MKSSVLENIYELNIEVNELALQQLETYRHYSKKRSKDLIIPVGCEDLEYSTGLQTINLGRTGNCMLISGGGRGVGKSVLGGNMFLDYIPDMGMHKFICDPKHEFWFREKASFKSSDKLSRVNMESRGMFNLKPRGHKNMIRVTPACLYRKKERMDAGELTQFEINDMNYDDLLTMCSLDPNKGEDVTHVNMLDEILTGKTMMELINDSANPDSLSEIMKNLDIVEVLTRLNEKDYKVIGRKFLSLIQKKAIGKGHIKNADILDYLSKGLTVIFQTEFAKNTIGLQPILSSYVGKYLREIIEDRKSFMRGSKEVKLLYPISLYFGEFDVYYQGGKHTKTSELITSIYDNLRYSGISIWGDAAHFHTLNPIAIEQSDFVFAFKLTKMDLNYLCKVKSLSGKQRYILEQLDFEKGRTPPAQVAILPRNLNEEEDIQVVYPLPPLSNIQEEQRYRTFKVAPEKISNVDMLNYDHKYRLTEGRKIQEKIEKREIIQPVIGEKDVEVEVKKKPTKEQINIMGNLSPKRKRVVMFLGDAMKREMPRNQKAIILNATDMKTRGDITSLRALIKQGVVEREGMIYNLCDWSYDIVQMW